MKTTLTIALIILACGPLALWAAEEPDRAAFLFAYYPRKGMEAEFSAGYRQHLEWHRERRDPLVWYGWYVQTGERVGMFVDGTFGLAFADFDRRIAPEEDAADFKRTTSPYGDTAYRKALREMPGLSTVNLLEERTPSANIEVLIHLIVPGREAEFEAAVARIAEAAKGDRISRFTFYKQLSGGEQPAYLLMIPRDGYAAFASGNPVASLSELVERSLAGRLREQILDALSRSIREVHSEAWSYREDMSYFPDG